MRNLSSLSFRDHGVSKFKLIFLFLAIISLYISCDELTSKSKEQPEKITEVKTSSVDNIHVAFAGGGWRAHTAHTAWTMSLLENNGNKLDNVFEHVESIGSNSGGSWFSTMLMYSPKFVTDIEKPGALSTWGNTTKDGGWLGGQQKLFDKATYYDPKVLKDRPCQDFSGDAFDTCVFTYYKTLTEWDRLVEKIVYADYTLNNNITLNSPHQKWATTKSLLLAATMLTNNVVLSENKKHFYSDEHYEYYQACLSTSGKVILNGNEGGSCLDGTIPDVTPVTFSSIPNSPNLNMIPPPFLPKVSTGSEKIAFNLGYSRTVSDADTLQRSIQNPLINEKVPVRIAAAASSAALGFAASKNITGYWDRSYYAEDLALNFSLANSEVNFTGTEGKSLKQLADNKVVRIADGGAADNSGVAQLVSFLQQNDKDSNFNIVAFDNVQGPPFLSGINNAEVGSDIALLFGKGLCIDNKFCSGFNCNGICITVPKLQIFEESALNSPITWSFPNKNESIKYKNTPKLMYTKYKVTTTKNSDFGVKAGSTGYLHAFTCYYPDAGTIPQNDTKNGSFNAYNDMMHFINNGLKSNSNEGLIYLEKAMGLK